MHILFYILQQFFNLTMSKTLTMSCRKLVSTFLAIFIVAGSITLPCNASPTSLTFSLPESAIPFSSSSPVAFPIPSSGSVKGVKGGFWFSSVAEKFPPSLILTSYFTHLFYAFVMPNATIYQLLITQLDDQWMGNFTATLHAKTPQVNVFLSIGGAVADPDDTFAIIARTPESREAFINSSISMARKYGCDGLDLDWEFPNTQDDMSNLALLIKECREAVEKESSTSGKPRLLLSAAVYFASSFFLSDARAYPAEAVKKYLDFVSPICYHGSWDTSVTGMLSALLYDKASNISTSYGISTLIEAGVPPKKLVMGMPLYGRTWQLKSPSDNGIGASAVGVGTGKGFMTYSEIVDFNAANGSNVVYDAETVSTYSYSGTNWIGHDGPESIENKVEFARAEGLGGYFFWALGYDNQNWSLSAAASNAWDS